MKRSGIWGGWAISFGVFFLAGQSAGAAEKITLDKLLDRMVSMDWLYRPPFAGEKQIQFSSYDRKSQVADGEKVDWFANADAGNYYGEREVSGGKEYVMADYQGAGMITRIWSANPGRDRWRIYLDGSDKPVIDEPGEILLGGAGEFFKPPFAGKRAMGYLLMFPIAFNQSCKVTLFTTAPKKPSRYFHVNIVNFPAGRQVETFQPSDLQSSRARIDEVAKALNERSRAAVKGGQEINFALELKPGEEKSFAEISGPGVVRLVEVKLSGPKRCAVRDAFNRVMLTGRFDDLSRPAVNAPLGAFFGSAPGPNNYRSLPSAMSWDKKARTATASSYWPMPFRKSARFSFTNGSKDAVKISGRVAAAQEDPGLDALYFHAAYSFIDYHPTRPFADWNLLSAQDGPGRYVGTMLSVRNPDYNWWGEGDEKVFVDGEEFPSIFGTGTEDYFSYAWGARYYKFDHAFYGMSLPTKKLPLLQLAATQNMPFRLVFIDGRQEEMCSQYRWQVIDQIPFNKSIEFNLELWHWDPVISFDVQAMSFWYGAAGVNYNPQKLAPGSTPGW